MEPVKSAPEIERKLVAIMAADVVGFSKHMERDEVASLEILSALREAIDGHIEAHGGRITSTAGDSVMAEFSSVLSAVEAAVEIQKNLWNENSDVPPERAMWFRIGINVGDVMVKGADIFGDGVNVASRLEGISQEGGICVSRGVFDYVAKQTSYVFDDMGEQTVKNIAEPIRAYSIRFRDGEAVLDQEAATTAEVPEVSLHAQSDEVARELALWKTVADSESIDELNAYLNEFPDGTFAEVAEARITALRADAKE